MKDKPDERAEDHPQGTDKLPADNPVPTDAQWNQLVQVHVEQGAGYGLTTTIVSAIAEAEGIEPRDVKSPPLYEIVDTAALEEAFFGSERSSRHEDPSRSTEFMYRGFRVVVGSDGWVSVYERVEQ